MLNHPDSPWSIRKKCGTCRNSIPAVSFKHHLQMFGHEEAVGRQALAIQNNQNEVENTDTNQVKKVANKSQTKIPCDYCGEHVTLQGYVNHCKKLHSISDADERCKRKCFKCGAKVHIVAEKFHHEIYPPAKPRPSTDGKPDPLIIQEHKKHMTKVPCDFCCDTVVFCAYKGHVKNRHPEVAINELVRCSKCGAKLPRVSFKFHRQIFHKSSKAEPRPIAINPNQTSIKLKFPQTKISCTYCYVRMKPHQLFSHLKSVHGDEATVDEEEVDHSVYSEEKEESPSISQSE